MLSSPRRASATCCQNLNPAASVSQGVHRHFNNHNLLRTLRSLFENTFSFFLHKAGSNFLVPSFYALISFTRLAFGTGMENQDITVSSTLLCPNCNRSFVPAHSFPGVKLAQLRSNFLPSSTEKSHTRHILEQEKDQLKLYDEELDLLDGIVKILKEKRENLTGKIKERESWMAGIRRLPVELLVEIFLLVCHCSSTETMLFLSQKKSIDSHFDFAPPLTLSQVSCHWRNVAFRCPHLWTSINVNVAQPYGRFEEVLRTYLENSGNLPLNIAIMAPGHWDIDDYRKNCLGDGGVAILDTILSQSFRFETLKFSDFNLDHGLSDTPKYTFPLLRRFETDSELEESNHWLAESLQEAPLLNTACAIFSRRVFPLPYCRLTSLTTQGVHSFHFFDNVLRKCPNLCRLYIDEYHSNSTIQDEQSQPLALPSIQFLSFTTKSAPSVDRSRLPNNISLPHLNQLSVTYSSFRGQTFLSIMNGLVLLSHSFFGHVPRLYESCPSPSSFIRSLPLLPIGSWSYCMA
ncbi:hypothetical protein L218DRAFT_665133 [Marasmius fiardii PR-910]|nr:hypothetical protein L218DRAFT_665133 [Marasmius fiardii PR-910]